MEHRLLLGVDHPLKEKVLSKASMGQYESELQHLSEWHRKVYSIGGYAGTSGNEANSAEFILVQKHTYLSAIVQQDNNLEWEGRTPNYGKDIRIFNKPSCHHRQVRLFIMSQIPAPSIFWQSITSCASLPMFQELLTEPLVRQMILTYGIVILESSSIYEVDPKLNENSSKTSNDS